jgi:stearoyl-CoA desaturase (delta-9 desaturase)
MIFAASFLILHWYLSLFCQSFYLHRYISHKQVKLSRFWDGFFLILTIIAQGPSFLRPEHYKKLHGRHHAYSDSEKDPHSPVVSGSVIRMMKKTYHEYMSIEDSNERFPRIVAVGDSVLMRTFFVLLYIALYLAFTDSFWFLLLVPIHSMLGPIHGAIVNWCGHKYGYQNHQLTDNSKNTLLIDFLMMGELYQNNHHANSQKLNFADNSFEIDFTYVLLRALRRLRIVAYE